MEKLTPELLARYNVPTPRYTSYPTALAFEPMEPPRPTTADAGRPVSLYFHMIFCRSMCWYCACTKEITHSTSRGGQYLDRLLGELELRADWLHHRPIVQMHLGGGTPTFFTSAELEALTRFVRYRFDVSPDAELSIEIDPREVSDEQIDALARSGYRRASLGVQDHEPTVQAAINRHQPYEMTAGVTRRLRAAGIDAVNFDLVYGLPHQTPESFRRTVEDVADLEPNRLAIYSYAHVPWAAPSQKLLTRNAELPGPAAKIEMFLAAAEVLLERGYRHIGMDHFARAEDTLTTALDEGSLQRNFMGYTTHRGIDIHAFGASAISQTRDTYFQNPRELSAWEAAIDAQQLPATRGITLTLEDEVRRAAIMGIMCSQNVDLTTLGEPFGVDAVAMLGPDLAALEPLARDGLVEVHGTQVRVTPLGRFLVRNVAAVFDARSRAVEGYSRAV